MELLKQLCEIHAPSGEEFRVRDFIIDYVQKNGENWVQKPQLFYGDNFQDCLLMVFGEPRCAAMAHMDSIGFTAAYNNELIPIGSPAVNESSQIRDEVGRIVDIYFDNTDKQWKLKSDLTLETGSTWTWRPGFKATSDFINSPFLDNRLGIYTLLQIAPKIKDAIIAFSTYEEMSNGGKAGFLARVMYSKWDIRKILIADITWVTPFVKTGEGAAISLRDVGIPRKKFRDHIIQLADESGISYQFEVEKAGGSDGTIIGASDYPIDWIFIGAPEKNPHGHIETVHRNDIESMIRLYAYLCERL